jgi:DNA-binding winged helix-turn-helix (wHTH) protein
MDSRRFRFGLFEFDAAALELRREGVLVRLQSQPAQVLASLVERADQVVSRDDLRKAIWGDETFVDFERGLNFCISQIRSALKDDSADPTYIRTVPKSGYQFIAPVQRIPCARTEVSKGGSRAAPPACYADSCSGTRIDRFGRARVACPSFPVRPKRSSTSHPRCAAVRQRDQ